MPFIGNLVYSLHIPLKDAWDFSYREYLAVCDAANPEEENKKTVEFSDDELAQLERLKKLV